MLKVSIAYLTDASGEKVYLQRRSEKSELFPGGLSFFGGKLEHLEDPEEAIKRELAEETTLDVKQIGLKQVALFVALPQVTGDKEVEVNVYSGVVPEGSGHQFMALEGAEVEVYNLESVSQSPDLVPTTRFVLETFFNSN